MNNCIYLDRVFLFLFCAKYDNRWLFNIFGGTGCDHQSASVSINFKISDYAKNLSYFGLRPKSYSNIICIYLFLIDSSDLFLDPCSDKRGPFFVFVHIIQKVILHQPTKRRQKKRKEKSKNFFEGTKKRGRGRETEQEREYTRIPTASQNCTRSVLLTGEDDREGVEGDNLMQVVNADDEDALSGWMMRGG